MNNNKNNNNNNSMNDSDEFLEETLEPAPHDHDHDDDDDNDIDEEYIEQQQQQEQDDEQQQQQQQQQDDADEEGQTFGGDTSGEYDEEEDLEGIQEEEHEEEQFDDEDAGEEGEYDDEEMMEEGEEYEEEEEEEGEGHEEEGEGEEQQTLGDAAYAAALQRDELQQAHEVNNHHNNGQPPPPPAPYGQQSRDAGAAGAAFQQQQPFAYAQPQPQYVLGGPGPTQPVYNGYGYAGPPPYVPPPNHPPPNHPPYAPAPAAYGGGAAFQPQPQPAKKKTRAQQKRQCLSGFMCIVLSCLCCFMILIALFLSLWLSGVNDDDDDRDELIIFVNSTPAPRITTFAPSPSPTDGSGWRLTGTLEAGLGNENAGFGSRVGFENGVLVASVPDLSTELTNDQGAVQSFTRSPTSRSAPIDGSSTTEEVGEDFGASIDITTNEDNVVTMIVGATQTVGAIETLVSFGSASVYTIDSNGNWIRTGGIVRGDEVLEEAQGLFGYSVTVASSVERIAVGAPSSSLSLFQLDVGRTYLFDYDGTNWIPTIATPILGDVGSFSGASVDITNDGTTLLVGAPGSLPPSGDDAGEIRVYSIDGTNGVVNQMAISGGGRGSSSSESFGYTATWILQTSSSERQFAVGGPTFGTNRGVIRAYSLVGANLYRQLGADIVGNFGEFIGMNLCGSETGRIGFGTMLGDVRLYDFNDNTNAWEQVMGTENLSSPGNAAVVSCSLSTDGTTMVVGLDSEQVAVFDFNET